MRLWFKTHPQPVTYTFEPNKVNVITGDSSTGKSSILRVIDYCLLAPESTIVEDVINENVAWYGLNFHLNGHDYVIARKAPSESGFADRDFYWGEDSNDMPDIIPKPTVGVTRAFLLSFFNQKFACDGLIVKQDKKEINISFRNFLLFNFLTEDIIATLNTYFDYRFFRDEKLDGVVSEIFKLGIGIDESQEQILSHQIKSLEREISNQYKYKNIDKENNIRYKKKIESLKELAKSLGLLDDEGMDINSKEFVTKIKSEILEFQKFTDSHRKGQEIKKLELEAEEIKEQLRCYKGLRRSYNKAKRYAEEVKDSLSPVEYLRQNLDSVVMGVETIELLHSLEDAYQSVTQIQIPDDYLPADMELRVSELKQKLMAINVKQDAYKEYIKRCFDYNWLAKTVKLENELKGIKPVSCKYIGDIELTNKEDLLCSLTKQYNKLISDNQKCINKMLDYVQSYYEQQDGMSDNYRNKRIGFDETTLTLNLYNNSDSYYPIRNIGSKSNYMFLHLCFFLGLQEYIKEIYPQRVANFLFIDQPSIPYYGTNRHRGEISNELGNLRLRKRDDESKLKSAFKLIDQFMKQNVKSDGTDNFQIILIEHADPVYWKDFSSFDTRYIFTQDKDFGLIPYYIVGE